MDMTKAEAARILDPETAQKAARQHLSGETDDIAALRAHVSRFMEACRMGAAALRPVSRERVDRVWRGEWMFQILGDQQDENDPRCQCSKCGSIETPLVSHRFCPHCGAPMTDEAVEMVMERMEKLYEQTSN